MKEQYGTIIQGVLYRGSKDKIYLGTEHTISVDLKSINAEGVGVYIGRLERDGFRPSIEGIQLIRPNKNIIELSDEQLWDWLRGFDLEIKTKIQGYCALSYKGEIIGPGKVNNSKLWNYVPKERRIKRLIK